MKNIAEKIMDIKVERLLPPRLPLKLRYAWVRRLYFPRWDKEGLWTVRMAPRLCGTGRCDRDNRAILVGGNVGRELGVLLIHEIAHAVTTGDHGKVYTARMERAARRARNLGDHEMERGLYQNIEQFTRAISNTPGHVYNRIEDCVLELPQASLADAIRIVGFDIGLPIHEMKKRFPRMQRVYEAAKKMQAQDEEFRARCEAMVEMQDNPE